MNEDKIRAIVKNLELLIESLKNEVMPKPEINVSYDEIVAGLKACQEAFDCCIVSDDDGGEF